MTDTITGEFVQIDGSEQMPDLWRKLKEGIEANDNEQDSWNPAAGQKKEFLNSLVAETEAIWAPQVEKFKEQLATRDERERFSIYLGLVNGFKEAFEKSSSEWVEKEVAALPKPEVVQVSDDRKAAVKAARTEMYTMAKQLYDIANSVGFDWIEGEEMPKIRRGGAGKRGPRALSLYDYWVDGKELTDDDNTPAGVAKLVGFEKASELTKSLKGMVVKGDNGKDVKLNTSNPPKTFEVTLNDHKILAQRVEGAEVEGDEEEEEEGAEEE